MLLELSVVEQRYDAVMEVLRDGLQVSEVARRYGVSRQSLHAWVRRYEQGGLKGLAEPDRLRALQGGMGPRPSRAAVYRALVRNRLIEPDRRRQRKRLFRRFERKRPMELWQLDVTGGARLEDRRELKVVTGVDDHSRFCVLAVVVERATAQAVCRALSEALRRHGSPRRSLPTTGSASPGGSAGSAAKSCSSGSCERTGSPTASPG